MRVKIAELRAALDLIEQESDEETIELYTLQSARLQLCMLVPGITVKFYLDKPVAVIRTEIEPLRGDPQ